MEQFPIMTSKIFDHDLWHTHTHKREQHEFMSYMLCYYSLQNNVLAGGPWMRWKKGISIRRTICFIRSVWKFEWVRLNSWATDFIVLFLLLFSRLPSLIFIWLKIHRILNQAPIRLKLQLKLEHTAEASGHWMQSPMVTFSTLGNHLNQQQMKTGHTHCGLTKN